MIIKNDIGLTMKKYIYITLRDFNLKYGQSRFFFRF